MAFLICSSSLISSFTARAFPPNLTHSSAVSYIVPSKYLWVSAVLAAIIILLPFDASFLAIALPIPLLAPVMNIFFPVIINII